MSLHYYGKTSYLDSYPPTRCRFIGGCNNFAHNWCGVMWQRKHAGLTMDPPTLVYCREHYPNYFGVIVETLNGPDGFIPPTKTWFTRKEHPWPEPPMTPPVNNEDMGMTPPVMKAWEWRRLLTMKTWVWSQHFLMNLVTKPTKKNWM